MDKLIPIEHKNQRVLTTLQLAEGYETDTDNISKNFNRNSERYHKGIHYFILDGEDLRQFKASGQIVGLPENVNKIFLWTEKGALLHAKSLNTDKAWDVYNTLVDTYFRVQSMQKPSSIEDLIILQAQSMKELRGQVTQLTTSVQTVKDTIITQPDNWRKDLNRMFNCIVNKLGNKEFQSLRNESYRLLEQRAHVDLARRLQNYQDRLQDQGKSKTVIDKANRLDVIEQDPKLREIYAKIIQEYTIRFVA